MSPAENTADLLVTGKYLYLQDKDKTIIKDGGVAILGDTIVETGNNSDLTAKYPRAEHLASEQGLILPGLINTHTHAAMTCFRGLADDLPLMQWLQEYIFPLEAKLTGDMVYQATLLSLAEMIKSGTTSFCDMYLFAMDVARAAQESGMRAWIGEVIYDFPSPNYGAVTDGLQYIEELFTRYKNHPLITITVDPHAVYTCSPDLLQNLKKIADKHDALYIIHLAENEAEVKKSRERYGASPVMLLEGLGILDRRVVADHCVMLSAAEIVLLAQRGVGVAHCPESNMKLASGIAPVPDMLAAGLSVGLGTDGSASNNNEDMFGEMNSTAKLHKAGALDPTVMPAETVLEMATLQGARVLGAENAIGSLEPGKKADLIVLDMNQPHLTPLFNIPSHVVYAARGTDVIHSVINGTIVMRNRQLTTLDEKAIIDSMMRMAEQVKM
ncbi:MAG: S-adenosylhomocysteine deaminase [Desulfobacterales bacterium SG8_35]|nr:MAG: S-adenosylhomocysteine deaminase [Desulfobacterales bacterium SG8_35]